MGLHKTYQYKGKGLEGVLVSWLSADTSKSSHLFSFKLINRMLKSSFKEANNHAKDIILFFTDPSSGNQTLWKTGHQSPLIGKAPLVHVNKLNGHQDDNPTQNEMFYFPDVGQ